MAKNHNWQMATQVIHGEKQRSQYGDLVSPMHQCTTFVFDSAQQGGARFAHDEAGYIYTRFANPTTRELEKRLAMLENADDAIATSSGMGAVSAALLSKLRRGDHLIVSKGIYGCTYSLLTEFLPQYGIEASFIDVNDDVALAAALQPNTKLIYCETPANPHLVVYDLSLIAQFAHEHGLFTIVDNTFMTPLLQRPIDLGIDLVLHSATKYLNGHGDVIAGVICGKGTEIEAIRWNIMKNLGAVLSPHDAWLILRGLKTLYVRLTRHCDNAELVAQMLGSHAKVKRVYYPNLVNDPGHKFIGKQMRRAGGVIAFELDADYESALRFINSLQLFTITVSLGNAESLVQHPASMTHSAMDRQMRENMGISDNLLRLAIGLESAEDLINDLLQALNNI